MFRPLFACNANFHFRLNYGQHATTHLCNYACDNLSQKYCACTWSVLCDVCIEQGLYAVQKWSTHHGLFVRLKTKRRYTHPHIIFRNEFYSIISAPIFGQKYEKLTILQAIWIKPPQKFKFVCTLSVMLMTRIVVWSAVCVVHQPVKPNYGWLLASRKKRPNKKILRFIHEHEARVREEASTY